MFQHQRLTVSPVQVYVIRSGAPSRTKSSQHDEKATTSTTNKKPVITTQTIVDNSDGPLFIPYLLKFHPTSNNKDTSVNRIVERRREVNLPVQMKNDIVNKFYSI